MEQTIKTTRATMYISWHVNCPHCREIQGYDYQRESKIGELASEIGLNEDTLEGCGVEYTCEKCGQEFEVTGIDN